MRAETDFQPKTTIVKCQICGKDFPKLLLINNRCRPCLEEVKQDEGSTVKAPLSTNALSEILQRLACFETPLIIAKEVSKSYDTEVSVDRLKFIEKDPECQKVIRVHRTRFLESIHEVPIAHKIVRLSRLEYLYHEAVMAGDVRRAVEVLAEARTEVEGKRVRIRTESKHTLLALVGKFDKNKNGTTRALPEVSPERIFKPIAETAEVEILA